MSHWAEFKQLNSLVILSSHTTQRRIYSSCISFPGKNYNNEGLKKKKFFQTIRLLEKMLTKI